MGAAALALGERRAGALDDALEGRRLARSEISQHLAVDGDPGALDAVHELGIGETRLARARVDPLDPERAEVPLLGAAITIGVAQPLLDLLQSYAEGVLGPAAIALGKLQDLLVTGMGGDAPFDARHGFSPSYTACR